MIELKPCPFCGGEATQPAQNPERAWCTNENCIMAFKIVLKRTWNTRATPAPSPSDAAGEPTHNDEQLKAFYYAMWTQARERYQKAEQRIKELEAPSPSDADEDDFALAPVKAGKASPSPSREGWPLTLADVQALRGNAKRRANAGFTHVEVAVGDELALCDMALSALRPAAVEGQ